VLRRAHRLRASIYRSCKARMHDWPVLGADLETLSDERARAGRYERLTDGPDALGLAWASDAPELDAPLWPVVRSAVALLTSEDALSRVGQCAGERCGWLFVDLGRGRPRRWCDMRDCGNVAKVRAYRRRQRERGPGEVG
ncbi:MAG: CGNR zinc finger domain-containing protein, partial [Gemmatimonadota bacterium]